jgi:hypothetical protein
LLGLVCDRDESSDRVAPDGLKDGECGVVVSEGDVMCTFQSRRANSEPVERADEFPVPAEDAEGLRGGWPREARSEPEPAV